MFCLDFFFQNESFLNSPNLIINEELSTSSDCQDDEKSVIAIDELSFHGLVPFPFFKIWKKLTVSNCHIEDDIKLQQESWKII